MNVDFDVLKQISPEVFESAMGFLKLGRKVKITRFEQSEERVFLKGLAEGDFGYYHNVTVEICRNYEGEASLFVRCRCYDRQTERICVHAMMLIISAYMQNDADIDDFLKTDVAETPKETARKTVSDEKPEIILTESETEEQPENGAAEDETAFNKEPRSMEILFGNDEDGEPLYWYPNDTECVLNTNTGIIGTMGTGKTQIIKSIVTQMHRNEKDNYDGEPIGILIFDYKGDYNENHSDFVKATDAKIYRPYKFPLNPFDLSLGKANKPALPLHVANSFVSTIGKIYRLGDVQKQTLLDCIRSAYLDRGIKPELPITWTRKAPTFDQVYKQYDQKVSRKGDSLGSAMKKLQDFQIFERDPGKTGSLFDLLKGVVVIDLSQYDSDIQNLIVAITLDLFYSRMKNMCSSKTNGRIRQLKKIILVDEADNFMGEDFVSLRKILKEGREFGVGTILSTQFLNHFVTGEDDYSNYIFTWIVHRVSNFKNPDVEYVFGVKSKTPPGEKILGEIKNLKKNTSIVKMGEHTTKIENLPFWKLNEHGLA